MPLVVVTKEMIQAGCKVLAESGIRKEPLEADTLLVERIYRAMAAKWSIVTYYDVDGQPHRV